MLAWLKDNIAAIIICAALIAVIAAIIVSMVRNKKKGKSACGCADAPTARWAVPAILRNKNKGRRGKFLRLPCPYAQRQEKPLRVRKHQPRYTE